MGLLKVFLKLYCEDNNNKKKSKIEGVVGKHFPLKERRMG